MTRSDLRALERRVKAARDAAWKADTAAREAKEQARDLAEARVLLEQELDLELWVAAQIENGIPEEAIDRKNRLIVTLPEGPTFDERPGQ